MCNSGYKKFLLGLSKLDERQIIKVLNIHPEYANKKITGWHSLHYACLLNNPHILDNFMRKAIADGMKTLPTTEVIKKEIDSGLTLLNFCAFTNNEYSYAKVLTFLGNIEEQNFEESLRYGLLNGSYKTVKLINKIIGEEKSQQLMLEFFTSKHITQNGRLRENIDYALVETFKHNPSKFDDYGIDIRTTIVGKPNYFTSTLKLFLRDTYTIEKQGINTIKNYLRYFTSKGFDFDTKDNEGVTPRVYLNKFIDKLFDQSLRDQLINFLPEVEKVALDNVLEKSTLIEPKKIKI